MSLKNENIGLVVGVAILVAGMLLTSGDPDELESVLIVVLGLGAAFWLSTYLNVRDGTYSRSRRKRGASGAKS